jgi:hypothetical protein
MVAPYRSPSALSDGASEAREIEAFARAMHAERRVWGNEDLGKGILGALVTTTMLIFCLYAAAGPGVLVLALPGLVWAALTVDCLRRWRATVALARADRAARLARPSIPPAA